MHEIHIRPCIEPRDLVLALVHHHAMSHRIGNLQQSRMFHGLAFDVTDEVGGQKEVLQGCRAALSDDVQHFAAVRLGDDAIHLDDNGAGDEILSAEVHARTVLRPATGNKASDGQDAAEGRKNKPGMIASDLEAKELHGVFFLGDHVSVQRKIVLSVASAINILPRELAAVAPERDREKPP